MHLVISYHPEQTEHEDWGIFGHYSPFLSLTPCYDGRVRLSGLSMQAMPGALGPLTIPTSAVAGRMAIHGMPPTALHSVLLVSNLNPDVSDSTPSPTLHFPCSPCTTLSH